MQTHRRYALTMLALLGWLAAPQIAGAQSPSRLQLGAQVAALRIGDFSTTNAGLGGRVSFELARWVNVEGEFNVFPRDTFETDSTSLATSAFRLAHHRRRIETFFGPKLGVSGQRFGLFAKVRPGFSRLTDRGVECIGEGCAVILLARPVYRTEFALDLGGVFEFYPTARTVARLDVGDTLIRHRSVAPPCQDCSSHNLATQIGVGLRF